jgi:hypothetical protein
MAIDFLEDDMPGLEFLFSLFVLATGFIMLIPRQNNKLKKTNKYQSLNAA